MRPALPPTGTAARVAGLVTAATGLWRTRTWTALARLGALGLALALTPAAQADEEPAPAAPPAVEAGPAAPAPSVARAQVFGPSANGDWVERLSKAHRRMLETNAMSDAANEAYAEALFGDMPEGPEFEAVKARRSQTWHAYLEARDALPELVEQARTAGVSAEALETYESSIAHCGPRLCRH